jgi:NADPH:quinone reductase-like Zn-dependent oxidoreductase
MAIGADRVIDYTKEDFTSDRGRYFSVFDAVGKDSFAHCRGVIEPGGTYLATDGFRNLLLGFWTSRFGDRKVMFKLPPPYTQQDVVLIQELMEAGSYRPVIDRVYPIEGVVEAGSRLPATSRRSRRSVTSSWRSATADASPHAAGSRLLMTCTGVHGRCRQHP